MVIQMQIESTTKSPYRASFMAIVAAATCWSTPISAGELSASRVSGKAFGTSRFVRPEREFYVVGQEQPASGVITRETTEREHVIAELRKWRHLEADWDGEGAKAPALSSLNAARSFLCAMDDVTYPEPMLFPSGRAGLYWRDQDLYADLEFYENNTIAYYIERGSDRHNGVAGFDLDSIPPIFKTLLKI